VYIAVNLGGTVQVVGNAFAGPDEWAVYEEMKQGEDMGWREGCGT
jgi:hypothetical protein